MERHSTSQISGLNFHTAVWWFAKSGLLINECIHEVQQFGQIQFSNHTKNSTHNGSLVVPPEEIDGVVEIEVF